ncbi:MAG: hypothetical protein PHQ34_10535 [Methanothrix sp.]|nr:hypothetical protein [Methanothrix sp.]
MARDTSSNNSDSNRAIQVIEATLLSAADKLRDNPDRKKQIKILGLNLGIAAADIITLKLLIGGGALATSFGVTIIFLSAVGVTYGNYRLFAEPEELIPPDVYYKEKLIEHLGIKTFEENTKMAIDQIERLQKKNNTIRNILPQIFGDSKITIKKFTAAIDEVNNSFFKNIQNIIYKLDIFDEDDYKLRRDHHEARTGSQQLSEENYNEYVTSIEAAIEENEQILLMLEKFVLRIIDLKSSDSGKRKQTTEMIDELIDLLDKFR